MPIIIIQNPTNHNTDFLYDHLSDKEFKELHWNSQHRLTCTSCGNRLAMGFTHIVRNLAKEGILSLEFIRNGILCCMCNIEVEKMQKEYDHL